MKTLAMPDDPTDAELLRSFTACRNAEAFSALVQRYAGLVRGVAARRLPDRTEAEDVVQEVFILLAEKAAALKPGPLGPWLHRVTVNVCRNHARSARSQRHLLLQVQVQGHGFDPMDMSGNASSLEAARLLLDAAIDVLPTPHRQVIVMRFFERQRWRDIGLAIGKSEDAARVLCSRAVERLGGLLRRQGVALPCAILTAGLGSLTGEACGLPPGFDAAALSARVLAKARPDAAAGTGILTRWGTIAASFVAGAALPVLAGDHRLDPVSQTLPVAARVVPHNTGGVGASVPVPAGSAVPLSVDDLISTLRSLKPWGNSVLLRVRVQRAMAALSAEDFNRVKDVWLSVPRTRQWYEAGEALFQRWGALDYHAAMAAIREHDLRTFRGRLEHTGYGFMYNARNGWILADANGFLNYQATTGEDVRFEAMGTAGKYHPWSECLRLAGSIPNLEKRQNFLWAAAQNRLPRDHVEITEWAQENDSGSNPGNYSFWQQWLGVWASRDPAAAFEYARVKWPDATRCPWPAKMTRYWASQDPDRAAQAMAAWTGSSPEGLKTLLGNWLFSTPEECRPFVERMPASPARDLLINELHTSIKLTQSGLPEVENE